MSKCTNLTLSGLEPFELKSNMPFINVGERTNVTGSRKFLRLIKEGNYTDAVEIAREQAEGGAQIIDVKEIPETGRVVFGATIKIYDIDNDNEISYKIVGNLESDPESGSISIDTPIAKTLVGKFVGDEISIKTPSGILNYEILDVKHK